MAIFNPEPPTINAQDWTRVTQPIEQPMADKSKGIALSTLGEGIDDVTKVADTAVKEDIKDQADKGVDKLRDAYTQSLIAVRNTQIASASTDGKSLLPDDGTPVPPGVSAGVARVQQIGTALAQNGGKINDTLYTGALTSLAKQLRSQYPGYRDYIDEQVKSVSGMDPANAFYKNLMEDINRNQENNKTQINSTLSTLKDLSVQGWHDGSGVTGAQLYSAVQQGVLAPDKALQIVNSAKKLEYDNKTKADLRTSRQGEDADQAIQATKDFGGTITDTINHNWNTMTIGKGTDTMQGISNFLQSHAGSGDITDERAQAMGQQLQAMRTRTAQQLYDQATKDGTLTKMGNDGDKLKKLIDSRLAPMDMAVQDVFNKDWGSAYSHMNFNKAIGSDTGYTFNNAPDDAVRKYVRGSQWISQNGGTEFAKEFQKQMLLGPVPASEKTWYQGVKTDLLAQPNAPQGKLTSIQGTIQQGQAAGIKSPKTYSELIASVDDLSNPKLGIPAKLNLAKAFFDPTANAGLLSDKNFAMDHYDPILKREVPGKLSVFTRFTRPETAAAIAELGKTDPSVVTNYRTMLSREFGEQLFSRELRDLGETNQAFTPNSNYKFKFTDDPKTSPHFEVVGPKGEPITMTQAISLGAPVGSLNRLNTGMAGLYTAMKGSGSADPTHDVMSVISQYNYQDASNVNNSPKGYESLSDMPRAIWNSLMSAQLQKRKAMMPYQSNPSDGRN